MGYQIQGEWKSEGYKFFGEFFTKFEAVLPSMNDPNKTNLVSLYLQENLEGSGTPIENADFPDLVELELEPGTYIMQLVPYSIIVGNPKNRPSQLFVEDVMPEGKSIKMLAIPAS
jgi:hypothetical protein